MRIWQRSAVVSERMGWTKVGNGAVASHERQDEVNLERHNVLDRI